MLLRAIRLLAFVILAALSAGAAEKVKVLIITGDSDVQYHDWRASTPFYRDRLTETGRFDVKVIEETRGLTSAVLAPYDVIVLNYLGPRWGEPAEKAVEDFVRGGKGMIAIHGISYGEFFGQRFEKRWQDTSSQGWKAYAEMLGMRWKAENIGHSARHVFPVKWVDREHPIAKGLEPQFMANDELYHKMDHMPNIHVVAAAYSDHKANGTGKEEPIIWTVPFGKGRVVHMTLGHDLEAMSMPGFVTALARGTEWAATGAVTVPAQQGTYARPAEGALRVLAVTGGHSYPTDFYSLFEGQSDLAWHHATLQAEAFKPGMKDRFDVVVLHDMAEDLPEKQRAALREFVEAGKGVVSMHHAIIDYTGWPWWWQEVVGGKYFAQPVEGYTRSAYKEGVDMLVKAVPGVRHPVLRGVSPLLLHDETYKGMWHSPKIKVLMETDHPDNDKPVVYVGPYEKARVIYIQPGHSGTTFRQPNFRRLVRNAILWTGGRLE
jgi:uncharacterized protein